LQSDHERDKSHKKSSLHDVFPERSSGFLLRSDVVAGWPALEVDGYDEPMQNYDFVPPKTFLFTIEPADCVSDLNKKSISDELNKKFNESKIGEVKIELSRKGCTVENQEWLISNSEPQFKLVKRENNQIDVCVVADGKYLPSIDGGFETDLNAAVDSGKLSTALQQAFKEQKPVLSENSPVSVVSWFITDNVHQKHYLIQKEDNILQVYREYKLPLLRMTRLSANVLICLFEGIVQTVDLHLKPDTLHCGVDKSGVDQDRFSKTLKKLKLTETTATFTTPNIGSNVTVSVQNSQSIAQNSTIFIQGAGAYLVISVLSTTSITVQNLGSADKVPPNTKINAGTDVRDTVPIPLRKLTETTASFTTPNTGSNVTVSVQNSQSIARGSTILIHGAGAYSVISVPSTTSITVQNPLVVENKHGRAGRSTGNVPPNTPIRARVIEIGELAKKIREALKVQQLSAAEFALQMIEGAEKVRFCSKP
jgi:hypothetical protein